jgi:hypothetical protein
VLLSRIWKDWRSALAIVKPETVIGWYRKGFLVFWIWKVRRGNPGCPCVSRELRDLGIRGTRTSNRNQEPERMPSGDGCFDDWIG